MSSPQRHSPPPIPPQLFRSLSRSPSNTPSPRTSSRLHPTIAPPAHPSPMITDTGEFRPTLSAPMSPVTTNNDQSKISAEYRLPSPSVLPPGDVPVLSAASTANRTGSPDQVLCQQYPDGLGRSGAPRAKFIQTLQGKSAWDALIHGSFSWCWFPCTLGEHHLSFVQGTFPANQRLRPPLSSFPATILPHLPHFGTRQEWYCFSLLLSLHEYTGLCITTPPNLSYTFVLPTILIVGNDTMINLSYCQMIICAKSGISIRLITILFDYAVLLFLYQLPFRYSEGRIIIMGMEDYGTYQTPLSRWV